MRSGGDVKEKRREKMSLLEKLQKDVSQVVPKQKVEELEESEQLELIQEVSECIISEPEGKLNNINTLFHLGQLDNLYVVQCALLSLAQVFTNICPMDQL